MTQANNTPGPALTSANVPQPPAAQPATKPAPAAEEVFSAFDEDSIVARPLTMPDFEGVEPKNPGLRLRWINREGPEGRGLRFGQARTQGFVAVVKDDIKHPEKYSHYLRDGHYINGDLILMKMDRRIYDGALKYKDTRAMQLGSKALRGQPAEGHAVETIKESVPNAPASQLNKISVFTPTEKEINAMTGADKDKPLR